MSELKLVNGKWVDGKGEEPTLVYDEKTNAYIPIITEFPDTGPKIKGADFATGLANQVVQGATARFGDELQAGLLTPVAYAQGYEAGSVPETYNRIRDSIRQRNDAMEQEHGVASGVARFGGALVPFSKMAEGAGAIKTALLGGAYTGAEYLGELDNFSDAELLEGVVRIGLGAALPASIKRTGDGIRKWLATRQAGEVNALLHQLIQSSGKTPKQIMATADRMGPEASVADATGISGVGYAQGAVGAGGTRTANIVEHNLSKVKGAKDRIRKTIEGAFGKKDGQYYESLDALKKSRAANAEVNYGKALNEGSVVPTDRMLNIFNTNPTVQDAWKSVQHKYAKNGLELPKLFEFDDAGKAIWSGATRDPKTGKLVGGNHFPNMRAMQELKWEMDKHLRTLKGSIDSAGKKEYSRALDDYSDFMDDVNRQNPLFKKANAAYAGDSAMLDAQELGFKNGLGSINVEAELNAISKMGKSEKDAYLQGVLAKVYGKLGSSPDEVLGNVNQMSSENAKRVLTALVGKQKASKLMTRIKTERRYREVENKVLQGSQTQPRQEAVKQLDSKMKTIPITELMNPMSGQGLVRKVIDTISEYNPKMSQEQVAEFANLITKSGNVEQAILRLEKTGMDRKLAEGLMGNLIKSGAAVAPATLME